MKASISRLEPYLGFAWAALLAWFDLHILSRWAFRNDRWEDGFFVLVPGLAAVSALLVLIGLVLRDEGLPRRMGRRWGALFAKAPVEPKSARHDLD